MKKILSMFMSIVMLLSITAGINITANAEDNGEQIVESFFLTPVKPYEIMENSHCKDEWYYAPNFNEGDIITVNYTNGTTDTFTYIEWDFRNKDDEYLNVHPHGFTFTGLGETTFTVELYDYGKSIDVPVTIIENPVESFTLTPVKPYEFIENTHCVDDCYYVPNFNEGDIITVNYTNGTTDTFTFDGWDFYNKNVGYLSVNSHGFTFTGLGETTFVVELRDYGKSIDVPVTIIENPVESFTLTPAKPYEIVEGAYDGYDGHYYVNFNEGDIITVNYTNGTTDTFTYKGWDFYNKDNEYLSVYRHGFTFTGLGETTFTVELYDYEKSIDVPVTIIESPVDSFTFSPAKPYEIMENTNGYYDEEEAWHYYAPDFNEGDIITVNYTNGTTDTFTCDGWDFYNENDEYLRVNSHGFTFTGLGETTFVVELRDYGKSIGVPVTIIENPVESFTLTPAKPYEIMEDTNGYYDEDEEAWHYYGPSFNEGDIITVNYTNGTTDTFIYDGGDFYNKDDEYLRVSRHGFTFTGPGETTFTVELYDYEKSIDVPVTIIENPVDSFELIPVKPYEIMEDTSGWYDEEIGAWCYELEDFNYGDKIIVNYKNGNKEAFEYKEFTGDYGFYNENNDGLNVLMYLFYYDGFGETSFKVKLGDYNKTIYVPVTITENPVESFTLKPVKPYEIVENTNRFFNEKGGGWFYKSPEFNNRDEITVNYTDGTTDTFIFNNGKFVNNDGVILQNVKGSLFKFDGLGETSFKVKLEDYNKSIEVPVKIVAASNPGGGSSGGGSTGGGSIGGGGGGFVPAPTPEKPATEPTTEPTTKPENNTNNTTTTTTTKKPATVTIKKPQSKKKSVVVTWKAEKNVSGYEVQIATNKKFKKNKKSVKINKKKASKKTFKNLKSNKKYYVRVRSYKIVNGKKVYGKWSKVKSVKTK